MVSDICFWGLPPAQSSKGEANTVQSGSFLRDTTKNRQGEGLTGVAREDVAVNVLHATLPRVVDGGGAVGVALACDQPN